MSASTSLTLAYTAGAKAITFRADADPPAAVMVDFSLDGVLVARSALPVVALDLAIEAPLAPGPHVFDAVSSDPSGEPLFSSLVFAVDPGDPCEAVRAMLASSQAENVVLEDARARTNEKIALAHADFIAIDNSARSKVTTLAAARKRLLAISARAKLGLTHLSG